MFKRKQSRPIVFEVQNDYSEDGFALKHIRNEIERMDAELKQGLLTEQEAQAEAVAIEASIRKLEEKYGIENDLRS